MDFLNAEEDRRNQALAEGSLIPGFNTIKNKKTYPGYKTEYAKRNLTNTYKDKDEIHHIMTALEMGAPFLNNLKDDNERRSMINFANSIGIRIANDPANLYSTDKESHRGSGPNSMHGILSDMQIDTSKGMYDYELDVNGKEVGRLAVKNFYEKIAQLPLAERKEALKIYAESVYDGMVENMHKAGHNIPTRQQNIKLYEEELLLERAQEEILHRLEQENLSKTKFNNLFKLIR